MNVARWTHRGAAAAALARALALAAVVATVGGGSAATAQEPSPKLVLGTGSTTGIYYAAGSAICRLLAHSRTDPSTVCSALYSAGSQQNLADLAADKVDVALLQSDVQHFAYLGQSIYAGEKPRTDLRHIVTLHPEALTLVARADTGMTTASDISGRRVNLGEYGSGTLVIGQMFQSVGFDTSKIEVFPSSRTALSAEALCMRAIDAFAFVAGHPNPLTHDAVAGCGAHILPVEGAVVDRLLATYPLYKRVVIPGGIYPTEPDDVPTVGVHATLVATADTPAELVYRLTRTLYEGLPEFRRLHLAFARFSTATLAAACNTAPLHPGAARYLAEAGIAQGPC